MSLTFRKATKEDAKVRIALTGPPGAGKTYTGLSIGSYLGHSIALIDTEKGRASKYADEFDFDVLDLETYHPKLYIDAIRVAEAEGYNVIIIDSLSHAWAGPGGVLDLVNQVGRGSANSFGAWHEITPLQNQLVDTILSCRAHIIATMRSKVEYVQEKNEAGKTVIRKIGLQPVQRDNLEYEFDVIGDMDISHTMHVTKSMCRDLEEYKGGIIHKPGRDVANILLRWLKGCPLPIDEINALGESLYGNGWPNKRAEIVRHITRGTTDDLTRISSREANIVLSGLHKRATEQPEEEPSATQQEEPRPAPEQGLPTDTGSPLDVGAVISPSQLRSLRNIATRHQWSNIELDRLVQSYQFASPDKVTEAAFPKICSDLRNTAIRDEFRAAISTGPHYSASDS